MRASKLTGGEKDSSFWKGGDKIDRFEYIKEQKKRLGENIDRVLELSNKRSHLVRQNRSDSAYL